jgi:hypothetical protein
MSGLAWFTLGVKMQIIVTLLKKSSKKIRKAYYKIIFTCTYFPECHSTMREHYSQPEELLADDSFLNWYFKTGGGEDSAWDEWIAADAGNKELAFRAVELLELTRLREKTVPAERIRQASDRLLADITLPDNSFVNEEAAHRTPQFAYVWTLGRCRLPGGRVGDRGFVLGRQVRTFGDQDGIRAIRRSGIAGWYGSDDEC